MFTVEYRHGKSGTRLRLELRAYRVTDLRESLTPIVTIGTIRYD